MSFQIRSREPSMVTWIPGNVRLVLFAWSKFSLSVKIFLWRLVPLYGFTPLWSGRLLKFKRQLCCIHWMVASNAPIHTCGGVFDSWWETSQHVKHQSSGTPASESIQVLFPLLPPPPMMTQQFYNTIAELSRRLSKGDSWLTWNSAVDSILSDLDSREAGDC